MLTGGCPSAELLAAFQVGKLPHDQLEQIAAHLDTCTACRTVLQDATPAGDHLVQELQRTHAGEAYSAESDCRRAIARIAALASGATIHGHTAPAPLPTLRSTLGPYQLLDPIARVAWARSTRRPTRC